MKILSRPPNLLLWERSAVYLLLFSLLLFVSCSQSGERDSGKKVVVLGIDGMDPQLLQRFVREGRMPHFAALISSGGFSPLETSIPPQSPVAWSNLITGLNPGEHGIFDFIHRDPATLLPYLSTSRVEPSAHALRMGSWILPLWGGGARLLRKGKAFWEYLGERRIQTVVYRMPANFPPVKTLGKSFAGMGTPDLLGTYGTFSFYTDDLMVASGAVDGGSIYPVQVNGSRVSARLRGPYNSLRRGEPATEVDFVVDIDPREQVARIKVQDSELLLREGEWSEWVPLDFELLPHLARVSGICKFYLKQVHPRFQLYVTPINIDPSKPALPLSAPESYSRELWEEMGYFYTQGIAEDTKALSRGVLTDAEYLSQARMVLSEQMKAFGIEVRRWKSGLLFFYFSSLDLNSHMFWRTTDPRHPSYRAELASSLSDVLTQFYQEMDRALGKIMERVDEKTTVIVLSDHGFAPYYRSFNLNNWLRENGYLALKAGKEMEGGDFLTSVDWTKTRAYALGLNGLYLNVQGREHGGIVKPAREADDLEREISAKLLDIRDGEAGEPVITRVDRAAEIYSGPFLKNAPDLLVGYNRGYRAGWSTVLGGFGHAVIEDNTDAWSGDHCIDFRQVPGVLVTNRRIERESPSLFDVAPTILAEFGIEKPAAMKGESVFGPGR